MFRGIGIVALVALALIAMPAVEADAHYTIINGKLAYHSFDCESVLKEVPLPEDINALGVCTVTNALIEAACRNPAGKEQENLNSSAFFPPAGAPIQPGTSGVAKKGKSAQAAGHLKVQIAEWDPANGVFYGVTGEEICNNNWTLIGALIREADVLIEIYDCSLTPSQACSIANIDNLILENTATTHCTLHPSFTLNNLPEAGDTMACGNPVNVHAP